MKRRTFSEADCKDWIRRHNSPGGISCDCELCGAIRYALACRKALAVLLREFDGDIFSFDPANGWRVGAKDIKRARKLLAPAREVSK